MTTNQQILDAIIRREGGFVHHVHDRGGATNYGITLATLSHWRGRDVTVDEVRQLTETEARAIYEARYLRPFDGIDESLKPQVVDIAVNSGISRARQLLALAEQNKGARAVNTQLVIERLLFYARLVRADPTQASFIVGWVNRSVEFL